MLLLLYSLLLCSAVQPSEYELELLPDHVSKQAHKADENIFKLKKFKANVDHFDPDDKSRYDMGSIKAFNDTESKLLDKAHVEKRALPLNNTLKWKKFKAKVDHFNSADMSRYDMRYIISVEFAKALSPPFIIYVGGEWEITEDDLKSGQVYEMAKENKGVMMYTEHRFYGKSLPRSNYSTENLKLLTHKQAMEDVIELIQTYKKNPVYMNSKVVLFGCSYSATLVTWTKITYPKLITAVYATSGPMEPKSDMYEYLEHTSFVMNFTQPDCSKVVKAGFEQLEKWYDEDPSGIQTELGICNPDPTKPYDKTAIFSQLADYWGNMDQKNPYQFEADCKKINDTAGEPADKIIAFHKKTRSKCTHGGYDNLVYWNSRVEAEPSSGRPFLYQQCNELGWFVTTNSKKILFGSSVNVSFYYEECKDVFSNKFTPQNIEAGIKANKRLYGGKNLNIRKAVFVYGNLDPWSPLGLNDNLNDEAIVYHMPSGDHCWDKFAESANDDESMLSIKRDTRAKIKEWLNA